ncbi:MAG: DUF3488 domain-containing protein [Planctomycetaceae bacterium]|nr:DUF3488 domain-containing protein [Planctomycetaceae bacterium]
MSTIGGRYNMIDQIAHVFRISIYLLVGLSSLTIGLSEGHFFPHALSLVLIAVAYIYLDEHPLLTLDSFWTSLLGIAALLAALYEFQLGRINLELRILSASHLLAYFTWIVLLIEKRPQQYWWLLALSILNMAVSASLTTSAAFGLSVLIYLILAIWTLAIFTAYRGTRHLRKKTPPTAEGAPSVLAAAAHRESVPRPLARMSNVRGGFHFDPTDNWLGYRLLFGVLYITFASIVVGLGVFMVTPRIWIGNFQLPSSGDEGPLSLSFGSRVSGFTEEVQLGDIGQILDNPTPVMSVAFSDALTGQSMTDQETMTKLGRDDLLFRGTTLSNYERGRWSENTSFRVERIRGRLRRGSGPAIRSTYKLEPIGRDTLFSITPVSAGRMLNESNTSRAITANAVTGQLQVDTAGETGHISTIEYEVLSELPLQASESGYPEYQYLESNNWNPVFQHISADIEADYLQNPIDLQARSTNFQSLNIRPELVPIAAAFDTYLRDLLEIDEEKLAGLVGLAQQICVSDNDTPLTPLEKMRRLNDHLRSSGEYSYTLNMAVSDPTLDPIEDFLFNRKQGHCEYFASALTLMLRAVGVPSRMATGFRTGHWDEDRNVLVIEQRHGHVWVEAHLNGKWITLDPTAPYDAEDEIAAGFDWSFWTNMKSFLTNFWQTHILGMSLSTQQERFYTPFTRTVSDFARSISSQTGPFGKILPSSGTRTSILNRLLMLAATLFPILIIFFVVGFLLFRRRLRHFLDWLLPQRQSARRRQMVLFFRKFLEIAARNGLARQPSQTAREFADIFTDRFHNALTENSLQDLPRELTEAYYRVRFQGVPLSEQEVADWDTRVNQLYKTLNA